MDEAEEWHRIAEERRRQLERMQDQTLYRLAAGALGRGRRAARLARGAVEPVRRAATLLGHSAVAAPTRLRARQRMDTLRAAVAGLPAPQVDIARRGEVTAVIVTAAQPRRLGVLLAALGRVDVSTIVVDNAGVAGTAEVVARHAHARRIRLDVAENYSAANERAIREVATPWTLLLNDDVAPLDDHWLDRMLAAAADASTVAVGAQLVHGPRGLLGGPPVDGRVQHAGVGFVLDGPLVRPVHLGRGTDPVVRDEVRVAPAATAACLLVRTAAHRAVGGLHAGFDYGSEDVDLCLRLAEHGAVRVALGAVLLHEEGATRLIDRAGVDRLGRAARQRANLALLDARHAPTLRRTLVGAVLGDAAADRDGYRLVIRVDGPRPRLLDEAARSGGFVVGGSPGALTVITDPRRRPTSGPSSEVPLVAWVDDAHPLSAWRRGDLDRVDALVVVGDAASGAEQEHPTLLVHRVASREQAVAALRDLLLAPRWTLRIGAPTARASDRTAARWGDPAIAEVLRRELRAHGLVVRVVGRDRWGEGADRAADVTVQLKGRGVAPTAEAQVNAVWVMSHPSEVAPGEIEAADLVIAASELLAERYRARTSRPVEVLPQATDARCFRPGPVDAERASRVLFIGNTRSVARPVVLGAVDAGLPLTLVGGGWERYLDPRSVRSDHVPYAELPAWYRSAEVVLNDHWDDMSRWGLVSNRVFDALACGACVVSDEVPGMDGLLDGAVVTFRDRSDVGPTVRALLDDPDVRADRAARGRRAVLAAHTWEHRAAELVRLVGTVVSERGATG